MLASFRVGSSIRNNARIIGRILGIIGKGLHDSSMTCFRAKSESRKILLVQPSSAAVERVYSVLKFFLQDTRQ